MTVYPIQATFSRGELSPSLHGRVDIDHYIQGLKTCENFTILKQGGIRRRSGSVYVAEVKDSADLTRLIPFNFSETEAYTIEMGDEYCRFYALGGQVQSGGAAYEVSSPFALADIFDVDYEQSADVLYMAHGSYAPRTLTRFAETSWAFADFDFQDGPYLDENLTPTTMTPADTGHATPAMTDLTTGGTVTSTSSAADAWEIFDRDKQVAGAFTSSEAGHVTFQFASSATKVVDAYWITAGPKNDSGFTNAPTQWILQGSNDGSTWVALDSRDGETGWAASETRFYEFVNRTAYEYYRLAMSGVDSGKFTTGKLGELALHQAASDQTAFNLTASSVTGINNGDGFKATDVGRHVRLLGSDNKYRWGEIQAYSSTTVVTITLNGHALPDTSPIAFWALGAWSDETGWPERVSFYEGRLCFASTTTQPRTVWASKSLDFDNFGISQPLEASDGIKLTIEGGHFNPIEFIEEGPELFVGTAGDMRIIGQSTQQEAFSATNARQKRASTVGASSVTPVTIQNTLIYVGFHKAGLYEFGYDYQVNGYVARELTVLSDHAFKDGISTCVYQKFPDPIIWSVRTDGQFIATTYEPDQRVVGVSRQKIAGGSADSHGVVESACVVPVETGNRVWLIVKRTINGDTKRYVEYMADPFDEANGDSIEDAVFFDSAVTVTGSSMTSVSGADHLEGETVGILADGVDIGDATVSSGSFTLPDDVSADKVTYGLRYESYAETLRLPQAGNRDGTALGRRKHNVTVGLDLLETAYIKAGTASRQFEYIFRNTTDNLDTAPTPFTGYRKMNAEDSWSNDGVAIMRTDKGYPATVRAVEIGVEGEP